MSYSLSYICLDTSNIGKLELFLKFCSNFQLDALYTDLSINSASAVFRPTHVGPHSLQRPQISRQVFCVHISTIYLYGKSVSAAIPAHSAVMSRPALYLVEGGEE